MGIQKALQTFNITSNGILANILKFINLLKDVNKVAKFLNKKIIYYLYS